MTNPGFSLVWNDYKSSLAQGFNELRNDPDLIDVTLGCQGRKFKAHKVLLSACSNFFRSLIKENSCKHPIIIIRGTNYQDLEAILEFIYNGQVSIQEHQLDSFLKTAKELEIKGLSTNHSENTCVPSSSVPVKSLIDTNMSECDQTEVRHTLTHKRSTTFSDFSDSCYSKPQKQMRRSSDHDQDVQDVIKEEEPDQELEGESQALEEEIRYQEESKAFLSTQEVVDNSSFKTANELQDLVYNTSSAINSKRESGESRNICNDCGKVFRTRNALLDHEHVHKGTTTCHECGRVCSTRGNLKSHMSKQHSI